MIVISAKTSSFGSIILRDLFDGDSDNDTFSDVLVYPTPAFVRVGRGRNQ